MPAERARVKFEMSMVRRPSREGAERRASRPASRRSSAQCVRLDEVRLAGLVGLDTGGHHHHVTAPREAVGEREVAVLYTSDAADDLLCVDLGGRRIIKKKK